MSTLFIFLKQQKQEVQLLVIVSTQCGGPGPTNKQLVHKILQKKNNKLLINENLDQEKGKEDEFVIFLVGAWVIIHDYYISAQ